METKLLPCPFCGREAKVYRSVSDIAPFTVMCELEHSMGFWFDTEKEAVEEWNTRDGHKLFQCEECGFTTDDGRFCPYCWSKNMKH